MRTQENIYPTASGSLSCGRPVYRIYFAEYAVIIPSPESVKGDPSYGKPSSQESSAISENKDDGSANVAPTLPLGRSDSITTRTHSWRGMQTAASAVCPCRTLGWPSSHQHYIPWRQLAPRPAQADERTIAGLADEFRRNESRFTTYRGVMTPEQTMNAPSQDLPPGLEGKVLSCNLRWGSGLRVLPVVATRGLEVDMGIHSLGPHAGYRAGGFGFFTAD